MSKEEVKISAESKKVSSCSTSQLPESMDHTGSIAFLKCYNIISKHLIETKTTMFDLQAFVIMAFILESESRGYIKPKNKMECWKRRNTGIRRKSGTTDDKILY